MGKAGKIALIGASIGIAGLLAAWLFAGALWSGAFNFLFPHEIAAYPSPDGEYTLVFEQMGDPAWPFGPADVRLTLTNRRGKRIGRIYAQVFNDGGSADAWNIAALSWNQDAVLVRLRGAEMEDREITIPYKNDQPQATYLKGVCGYEKTAPFDPGLPAADRVRPGNTAGPCRAAELPEP